MNIKHFIEEKKIVAEITEEIDHHTSERIRSRLDYEIQRFMPKKVIIDLQRVSFMDSAGIGLIIGRYKQTACFGGVLELQNVSPNLQRIFEMSGINKIINIKEYELSS